MYDQNTQTDVESADVGFRIDPVLARSWLLVNGAQSNRFAQAARSRADIVVLDIEDAVQDEPVVEQIDLRDDLEATSVVVFADAVLLAFAGVATAVPLLLFAAGTLRVDLAVIGMLQFLTPILQFVIGVAVLQEPMPPERWIGFLLVWVAIAVFVGIAAFALGSDTVGATLVLVGAGSMLAASLVLLLSSPDKASAALKQGVIPALGVIALAIGLLV